MWTPSPTRDFDFTPRPSPRFDFADAPLTLSRHLHQHTSAGVLFREREQERGVCFSGVRRNSPWGLHVPVRVSTGGDEVEENVRVILTLALREAPLWGSRRERGLIMLYVIANRG